MRGGILIGLAASFIALGATVASAQPFTDKDCADFPSQLSAQTFFVANGAGADPHRLDRDKDGQACEDRFRVETPLVGPAVKPAKPHLAETFDRLDNSQYNDK